MWWRHGLPSGSLPTIATDFANNTPMNPSGPSNVPFDFVYYHTENHVIFCNRIIISLRQFSVYARGRLEGIRIFPFRKIWLVISPTQYVDVRYGTQRHIG